MSEQKQQQAPPAKAGEPAGTKAPAAPAKKKERKETPIYKFYQVKGDRVERLRKECPRCGRGVFLAEHKDRQTCGKCGYTAYKKTR